jgi:hypothetical protein
VLHCGFARRLGVAAGIHETLSVCGGQAVSRKRARVGNERAEKSEKKKSANKSLQIVPSAQSAETREGKPGTQTTETTNEPADIVQVRENINSLVAGSAEEIAKKVIAAAMGGQLASARYLFEAVGLYPATEETKAKPKEDSLAYTLLRRMGLPTEPLSKEDPVPDRLIGNSEILTCKLEGVADKNLAEQADEEEKPDFKRRGDALE